MLAPNHNNPQINTQLYTQLYNTWNTSQILCSDHYTQQQIVSTEHTVMYKALHTATHSWALRHICIVMNRAHNYAQIPKLFTESQIFSTEHTVMYKAQSYVQRTQLCTKHKVMYSAHSYVQITKLCTGHTVMYKAQSYVQSRQLCTKNKVMQHIATVCTDPAVMHRATHSNTAFNRATLTSSYS